MKNKSSLNTSLYIKYYMSCLKTKMIFKSKDVANGGVGGTLMKGCHCPQTFGDLVGVNLDSLS